MWARGVVSLIVVALWACVAAAQQPVRVIPGGSAGSGVGEPNDPNRVWDPAQHLAAAWQSMSVNLGSTIYNPVTKPNQKPKVAQRSLSMSAQVNITDPNGLLGFCWATATGVQTLDQNGKVNCSRPNTNQSGSFYWPPMYIKTMSAGVWVAQLQPYTFSIDLSPDPNAFYPLLLSKVEWSMYALVTDTLKTVDVPFKVSDQWVELASGLEIRVDKASAVGSSFDYSLSIKYSPSKATFWTAAATFLQPGQKPAPAIVTKIDVLDAQGKSIQDQASGGAFGSAGGASGSGDEMSGSETGTGNCTICGTAATIRFTLALNAYEKEARFMLANVPVPSF